MTRQEIREMFYEQTTEADKLRNAKETTIDSWLTEGEKDFVMRTYCIVEEYSTTTTLNVRNYDLLDLEPLFLDVDIDSGGVWYDDESLTQTTQSQLSNEDRKWRNHLGGTVNKWWLRKSTVWLDKNPKASKTLIVSIAKKPNPLIQDSQIPFDELSYLEPYHIALVKYLQMRFKSSLGKEEGAMISKSEYEGYINECKDRLSTGRSGSASFEPMPGIYQPYSSGGRTR
jgi:hypothetical protein